MFGLSATHLIILLIIVLIIFGGGKLPDLGRQLGTAINEFKNSVRPQEDSDKPTTPPNDKQA
ncbi:MAG TPA: twin-arginine translocase TatA/TatE family subunit [Candidatus Hydrogenedentes bacterium]|nr:twin-arginine translocase TatA/TatE family subunit [Candidatus Hydrogenedentota bacterium]HOV74883.1 twin-arginine translocase TatA/TatE family subunit [Candidatus Hydrogenedentota bacterium]HPC15111.1 twin-arginine translocase TatA/TatE family subunit [Candidatus Hydrogenedentota bacterium]HRT21847.1 twin-arginine translocase TatA/TatE family subunit [Candidatus Hydrogenedentota bacterium]HRT64110.1 twin-arginine translocase TatA/TatE family subunit [Candidatus Hydrogenedentota bacterium]